jgi:hypothetical protein
LHAWPPLASSTRSSNSARALPDRVCEPSRAPRLRLPAILPAALQHVNVWHFGPSPSAAASLQPPCGALQLLPAWCSSLSPYDDLAPPRWLWLSSVLFAHCTRRPPTTRTMTVAPTLATVIRRSSITPPPAATVAGRSQSHDGDVTTTRQRGSRPGVLGVLNEEYVRGLSLSPATQPWIIDAYKMHT